VTYHAVIPTINNGTAVPPTNLHAVTSSSTVLSLTSSDARCCDYDIYSVVNLGLTVLITNFSSGHVTDKSTYTVTGLQVGNTLFIVKAKKKQENLSEASNQETITTKT
jgi:hypothetical protein